MPAHLFIDTNILLSFYHLSSDDLEELRKLVALLRTGTLKLHLPEQVKNEFSRNREGKIADALKRLQEQKLNLAFPTMCKDYPEYESLRIAQRNYESAHSALLQEVRRNIETESLKADLVIHELFATAQASPTSQDVFTRAHCRCAVGNPPGKSGSLGDAINWEVLLQDVPNSQELWFVTDDSDYLSPLDREEFNAFLMAEWNARKGSSLVFFKRLSLFFEAKYPQITLASGVEKDVASQALVASGSFASTHSAIEKLDQFADFSPAQARAIATGAVSNDQISRIMTDPDVKQFMERLIRSNGRDIDARSRDYICNQAGISSGAA